MSVHFEPWILSMPAPYTDSSECSLTIHNNTKHEIKFKVKVTEALLFVAKPNIGMINAGCIQIVIIRYKPPVIDFPKNPKSQIQYIELDNIEDEEDVFAKYSDRVQHKNFRMVFPVPEQSFSNIDKLSHDPVFDSPNWMKFLCSTDLPKTKPPKTSQLILISLHKG